MKQEKIQYVNIEDIQPNPDQPRDHFDEKAIKNLAISIKEYGIINPIIVKHKENKYEIIAGERRYRAAKLAGLEEIPIIVKEIDELKIEEIALIENLHRENLNPIEEAKAYKKIINNLNITQEELGKKVGKSQAYIANKIRNAFGFRRT